MRREEIQIVRRRLDDYSSYKALAYEADQNAMEMQSRIDSLGHPQSPSWGSAPVQNHIELSSRLNEIISDQMQYIREAEIYRARMDRIEAYIADNFDGLPARIMQLHYLEGIPFEGLEEMLGYSSSSLKSVVYRTMEACPFRKAAAIL